MKPIPQVGSGSDEPIPLANILEASSRDLEIGQIQDVVDCEENWTLIRKWLKICQDTHTACSQNSSDRQLPTRLLDVGVSDMDLKLRLSKSLPPEAPYLTLSHCWGGKVFTTLTRNNFQDFLSHIPTSSLSKTFIEAIISTRKLGFRYLWIDSLCIIQGDEADWQHEASMMGTVYANSELNIAASAAPNGDFGCFTTRKPGQVFACRVLARTERGSLQTSVWDCTIEQLSWELLDNNVLNSRAWVYQERFLAPRSLHFTAHQLAWECVSSRACETFPDSFIDNTVTAPAVSTCDSWNDTAQDIADKWAIVVSGYSSRSVTFSRDKLVAISGVSRLFAAKFGTTYLAGMWKEDLVKQLAWYTDQASENDALGSIPTWSWAAVNTGVIFQNPGMLNPDGCIRLVSILQATTVVSNDYFGEVKQGSIQLRCRVPCFGSVTKQHTSKIFTISSGSRGFLALIFLDATLYYLKDEMYFLALLRGTKWNDEPLLCGLVIEPTGPVECRRIGYFQVLGADRIQEFITAQQEASTVDKHFIREALGVDQDGNKMCIITII